MITANRFHLLFCFAYQISTFYYSRTWHFTSRKTLYVRVHKRSGKAYGFGDHEAFDSDVNIRFNGEEMKAAFKALRNAGYHMFRIYEYGSWKGYICDKKPFIQDGEEVTTFNDFID